MRTGKPSPFEMHGGIGGHVHYREGPLFAKMGYEMAGGDIEMIVFSDDCRWYLPEERDMAPEEVVELVQRLASALPGRVAVLHTPGDQVVIEPRDAA
jgi:hypothetical protein